MSWKSDSYGFAFLQSMITDDTTQIINVYIEGSMYGRNYGRCGALATWLASNASITNVTVNISSLYFYYGSGFVDILNTS